MPFMDDPSKALTSSIKPLEKKNLGDFNFFVYYFSSMILLKHPVQLTSHVTLTFLTCDVTVVTLLCRTAP
jgi:hypothetical protein